MLFQDHTPSIAFKSWIWKNNENRRLILASSIAILVLFTWHKLLYPCPNFIPDSNSYLLAATTNRDINTWPIGYSKFLRLFSTFTNSPLILVIFQYLLLQSSTLYFLFTIKYLLNPDKWVFRVLIGVSILNPLSLYASNLISADALFTALSLIWSTQLLWILCRPTMRLIIFHALILFFAFATRYNALYYPFISVIVILLAQLSSRMKTIGIGFIIIALGAYIGKTQFEYKKLTGKALFIPALGWQLTGNALYAYEHLPLDSFENIPPKLKRIKSIVNQHIASLQPLEIILHKDLGYYYQFNNISPLYEGMNISFPDSTNNTEMDQETNQFKKWALMGPLYKTYGKYLIERYPNAFLNYYVKPNLVYFYTPKPEFLGIYNMGSDTLENLPVSWFGLKTNKIHSNKKRPQVTIPDSFSIVFAIINIVFLLSFIGFVVLDGFQKCGHNTARVFKCALWLWLCNFFFSVLAAPVVLRYQLSSISITCIFAGLLVSFIIKKAQAGNVQIEEVTIQRQAIG